jgi:soluble lytic murein transglycosylase-like protein
MSVQKAIFPGIALGILFMLGFISLVAAGQGTAPSASAQTIQEQANAGVQEQPVAVEAEGCSIHPEYPASVQQWCQIIERYAGEHGLDPNLVSAVMLQESAGQPDAYSKSGAVGLMQVMPRDGKAASFMCINGPCFADRPSTQELFDPEFNVAYGTRMLSGLIQRNGDVREALKAYGPKDVGYYYADIVLGIFNSKQ